MKLGLQELSIIDTNPVWLAFSIEDEKRAWPSKQNYSYDAAYWNAYLNSLCLNAFVTWLKEYLNFAEQSSVLPSPDDFSKTKNYLEFTELFEVWPSQDELSRLWEFVNGTAIQIGEARLVLIPTEAIDVEEFCVQQEWVDISSWVANYYLAVQVNLDNGWLRVLGYTTHQTLKQHGRYDKITRTYSLDRTQLIADLNVMWMARELCPNEKADVEPLPKLSLVDARRLVEQFNQSLWCSPRLDVEFEHWGAILADKNFRWLLYNRPPIAVEAAAVIPSKKLVNLSGWLQRSFEVGWQSFEELLGAGEANLAFAFRSNQPFRKPAFDQTAVTPALIDFLHTDSDEETRLKAAECLGAIAPGNSEAIAALIDLLHTSQDKWTRYQAAKSLGRISTGNSEAVTALTTLLHNSQDDHLRWQAALSLGQIDPSNPEAGVGRGRHIDLGMELAGHSVALLVALRQEADQEVGIFLRVYPTGSQTYLPPNLKLIVLNPSGKIFAQAQARSEDNWIQLQFGFQLGDQFSVKVAWGDASHTEDFVS